MKGQIVTLLACVVAANAVLEVMNQWNLLQFDYPDDPMLLEKIKPENTIAVGLEIGWNKLYLGIPRLLAGVPATLAWIPRNLPRGVSPVLKAYPDWSWHSTGRGDINCTGLISVFRIRADRCNRLWVLDSGVLTTIDNFRPVCPPKILVFDMVTDRLVRNISLPSEVLLPNSLLTNIVLDDTWSSVSQLPSTCNDIFAYISDTCGSAIIVYDGRNGKMWRISHPSMYPDPDMGEYRVGGEKFTMMDGVVGLALSPAQGLLYYQPLAGNRLYSISTAVLTSGPPAKSTDVPVNLLGRKLSQGLGLAVDPRDDTIIFSLMTENAISTWSVITNSSKLLVQDDEKLQFCTDVRWADRDSGAVWAISTQFQKFFKHAASKNEIITELETVYSTNFVDKSMMYATMECTTSHFQTSSNVGVV